MKTRTVFMIALSLSALTGHLSAQDPFEIVVYPAATLTRGEWELETHLNYTARGTTTFDGTVAPTEHQTHLSFELSHGITSWWEASAYFLSAYRPGLGAQYAGWRLRSRVSAPARWKLPVEVGFSAELEAPRPAYGGASPTLELSPIVAKRFGALRLGLNANLERDLGAGEAGGTEQEWEFEPSAVAAYRLSSVVTARVEYHGALGEKTGPLAASTAVHQIFPGVDLDLGKEIALGLSVGFGTTSAGNRLVFASRLELDF
ncbi:MAG TPA: hypothetical protein VKB45_02970 [Gemmatimonadales bacterium]|nr:hypothetical protein [Gemmatimonadales bacterium]